MVYLLFLAVVGLIGGAAYKIFHYKETNYANKRFYAGEVTAVTVHSVLFPERRCHFERGSANSLLSIGPYYMSDQYCGN